MNLTGDDVRRHRGQMPNVSEPADRPLDAHTRAEDAPCEDERPAHGSWDIRAWHRACALPNYSYLGRVHVEPADQPDSRGTGRGQDGPASIDGTAQHVRLMHRRVAQHCVYDEYHRYADLLEHRDQLVVVLTAIHAAVVLHDRHLERVQ